MWRKPIALKNQQLLRTSQLSRLTGSREERDILCEHQPSIQGVRKDHRTTDSPFQGHKILKIIEHLIWSSTEMEIVPFQWNSSLLETSSNQFFSISMELVSSRDEFQPIFFFSISISLLPCSISKELVSTRDEFQPNFF